MRENLNKENHETPSYSGNFSSEKIMNPMGENSEENLSPKGHNSDERLNSDANPK